MSYRTRFPRFIRSSQDARALFEEQRRELEALLAQWQWEQGPFPLLQAELPLQPGLLGGRNSPQHRRVQRPDMDSGGEEDDEDTGRHSRSPTGLGSSRSTAMAWFIPREVVITNPLGADSSSSSSSSSSLLELARSIPTPDPWWGPVRAPPRQRVPPRRARSWAPQRFLGKLHAQLRGFLGPWWSCHVPSCQCPHPVPPCQCHRHARPSRVRFL
ncbi:uncharacterized protein LOC114071992 [Empidonax traillii]|uniref:uncharacterized protein LOC114071992 n=1 Tax=Empidonax traillii TaxID=164674 RepID=UPI000FFCF2BA|nr:uncharacterized protein LOC114071992 [Empidonax traillii]